jgi:hypothetical protein
LASSFTSFWLQKTSFASSRLAAFVCTVEHNGERKLRDPPPAFQEGLAGTKQIKYHDKGDLAASLPVINSSFRAMRRVGYDVVGAKPQL